MNNKAIFRLIFIGLMTISLNLLANSTHIKKETAPDSSNDGEYNLIIEGYDWGPAVSKIIFSMKEPTTEVKAENFTVTAKRSYEGVEMSPEEASGARKVVYAYTSDEKGNKVEQGNHITLVLFVGPEDVLGSPIKYIRVNNRGSNKWINYELTITDTTSNKVWNSESKRFLPLIDKFNLTGIYSHNEVSLPFASFEPENNDQKLPLIIWLHGGGEGGNDPSIPLIANRAANYASDEIQGIFKGAYVLAPQSPTFWMQSSSGAYTRGKENDIYNEALLALIKNYVTDHPDIDPDRIYVGGCSNGGYMALKLIFLNPDYFAAGYISALAYQNEFITNEQVDKIKDVPIWFVHSKDDGTTLPEKTVVPLYNRLINAGANNVHFSFYDHVTDITGFFGGDNYYYNGHWSWIYSHANHANFDFDGSPVLFNNRPVTIMEWLAEQRN